MMGLMQSVAPPTMGLMQQAQPQFDPSTVNPMALQYAQMFYPDMDLQQALPLLYGGQMPAQPGAMPMGQRQMVDNGNFAGGIV